MALVALLVVAIRRRAFCAAPRRLRVERRPQPPSRPPTSPAPSSRPTRLALLATLALSALRRRAQRTAVPAPLTPELAGSCAKPVAALVLPQGSAAAAQVAPLAADGFLLPFGAPPSCNKGA